MKEKFRYHHALTALENWEEGPLDLYLSRYFRSHRALGSKDRRAVGELVYGVIRCQVLLDHLGASSWRERLQLYQTEAPPDLPPHVEAGLPEGTFQHLARHYGNERALALGKALGTRAPTTVRANALKTTRKALIDKIGGRPCEQAPLGITFDERVQLMQTPEFLAGHFELQDESSQLVAGLVQAGPGDHVLDYCAGSGGKSLAIAPLMEGKGQLYLHDIRQRALRQARKRLNRAGVQNIQFGLPRKKVDWLLVDAPCTGSGSWRRSPEQISRFDVAQIPRFVALQREILEEALDHLAPGGKLVYATCSIFPEENELQVEGMKVLETFQSFPEVEGMDGMYGAVICATS